MTRIKRSFVVVALSVMGGVGISRADTVLGTSTADTTGTSSVTPNADGSFTLQTQAGFKSSLYFYLPPVGGPMGTLSDLSNFSATFKTDSADTANTNNELAFRFFLDNSTSLVWETNYQTTPTPVSTSYQTVNFTGGNFWEHDSNGNHANAGDWNTLSSFKSGFTPSGGTTESGSDKITLVQVSYGSGLGAYTGTVENVKLDFANGGSFIGAPSPVRATPLPTAAYAGLGLLGVLGLTQLKRKTANA